MINIEKIPLIISLERKRKKISYYQMIKDLPVNHQKIKQVENGDHNVYFGTYLKIYNYIMNYPEPIEKK